MALIGTTECKKLDLNNVVRQVFDSFNEKFPHKEFNGFVQEWDQHLENYANTTAATAYNTVNGQSRCPVKYVSRSVMSSVQSKRVTLFDGGASVPVMGMSLAESMTTQLAAAPGPAAAQVPGIAMLAKAALGQVKGVLQTVAAVVATDVPPMIPAPAWNNMPFPCMPMVTGHNCFGAVLYPITIGDFIMADVTDSAMDGVIASFPSYYRSHIGATDQGTYQRCFNAYMSMQCANAFPTCTTVQAQQSEVPFLGRGPMCFLHCIATLIACPGMWIDDLEDICQHVSVPPVCSFAVYVKSAPAQLTTHDEAQKYPLNCPSA
jgi:hypothetical protein